MERRAEEAAARLSASILARYHEEQIWSDKIRRMSTWGTWGLMGVNVLLFLVFQIGVEPWRRKRLVKGFEDKVMEALEREGSAVGVMPAEKEKMEQDAEVREVREATGPIHLQDAQIPTAANPSPNPSSMEVTRPPEEDTPSEGSSLEFSSNDFRFDLQPAASMWTLHGIREWIRDMFSERRIVLRRIDLTTAALEGAATGMAVVGTIVLLLRLR